MKPFLLLATRAEDAAADNEYEAFLGFTGLTESSLRRWRLERDPLGTVDLDAWSGIMLGGGPFNASDPSSCRRRPVSYCSRLTSPENGIGDRSPPAVCSKAAT